MKRKMKLLFADLLIGAMSLVLGGPLWCIGMIDLWKATVLRFPLLAKSNMRANTIPPKCCKTFLGEHKEKGEQLI